MEQPFPLHGTVRFLISRFFLIFPHLVLHSEPGMGHRGHLSSACAQWVLNPLKRGKTLFNPKMFADSEGQKSGFGKEGVRNWFLFICGDFNMSK